MNDSELIAHLGGPTRLAKLLGYEKDGGVQRVQNWITRGIPAQVKIDFQAIFLNRPELAQCPQQTAPTATPSPNSATGA